MNERIQELADQAWKCAEHPSIPRDFDMGIFEKKFAELIVQECCEQVEQAKHSPFVSLDDAKRMQHFVNVTKKKINKHFGVNS